MKQHKYAIYSLPRMIQAFSLWIITQSLKDKAGSSGILGFCYEFFTLLHAPRVSDFTGTKLYHGCSPLYLLIFCVSLKLAAPPLQLQGMSSRCQSTQRHRCSPMQYAYHPSKVALVTPFGRFCLPSDLKT